MALLPLWARKPKHKKTVVATQRGWEVESTGEILKRVPRLADRLLVLLQEMKEVGEVSILTKEPVIEVEEVVDTQEPVVDDVTIEEPAVVEEEEEKPKKRGRKPKPKPKDDSVKIDD